MAHTDIFIAQYTIIMGYNIIQYLYFLYRYMSVLCSVGQNIDTLITLLLTFAYMMVFFFCCCKQRIARAKWGL